MTDDIPARVAALETSVQAIGTDVKGMSGQLDKVVAALTQTDGRVAERAQAVKSEIRDEGDRKAKDRSELFKSGLALIGGVAMIVTALCGPYLAKLDATSGQASAATQGVAAVREVLAQQGAGIGRNRDSLDIIRERNRRQDEQLNDLNTRVAHIEGARAR